MVISRVPKTPGAPDATPEGAASSTGKGVKKDTKSKTRTAKQSEQKAMLDYLKYRANSIKHQGDHKKHCKFVLSVYNGLPSNEARDMFWLTFKDTKHFYSLDSVKNFMELLTKGSHPTKEAIQKHMTRQLILYILAHSMSRKLLLEQPHQA